MDLKLRDKVIIITGGAKGIGAAISNCLANEEAIPVIVSRNEPKELIRQIKEEKQSNVLFIQAELTDEKQCKNVVETTIKTFGKIDGLVNNAGLNDNVDLEAGTAKFVQSLHRNLIHYYSMMYFCRSHLIKSKGSIVNISSKTAITGQGHTSGYASSKGGQLSLTREWALALINEGVRVNAVIPAEVMTELYQKWLESFDNPKEQLEKINSKIPLGKRMTLASEIADMVVFLLSSRSSHTTGQWIYVDGGYTHLDRLTT